MEKFLLPLLFRSPIALHTTQLSVQQGLCQKTDPSNSIRGPSGLRELTPWLSLLRWGLAFRLHLLCLTPHAPTSCGLSLPPLRQGRRTLPSSLPPCPAHDVTVCHQQRATASCSVSLPLLLAPQPILSPAIRLIFKCNSQKPLTQLKTLHRLSSKAPAPEFPGPGLGGGGIYSPAPARRPALHADSTLPAPSAQRPRGSTAPAAPSAAKSPLPPSTTCLPSRHPQPLAELILQGSAQTSPAPGWTKRFPSTNTSW